MPSQILEYFMASSRNGISNEGIIIRKNKNVLSNWRFCSIISSAVVDVGTSRTEFPRSGLLPTAPYPPRSLSLVCHLPRLVLCISRLRDSVLHPTGAVVRNSDRELPADNGQDDISDAEIHGQHY